MTDLYPSRPSWWLPTRINPNHVPKGPKGGQFAPKVGGDGGGLAKGDAAVHAALRAATQSFNVPVASPPQPYHDEHSLYSHAQTAQTGFENLMDHGNGVDKRLGADDHVMHDASEFDAIVAAVGAAPDKPHVVIAPIKSLGRAREKVDGKYAGDWGRLTDVVRGTVVSPDMNGVVSAIVAVHAEASKRGWNVTAMENRFTTEHPPPPNHVGRTAAGYGDFSFRLESPDGIQTELQFSTRPMFVAKMEAHKIYEEERSILARPGKEGRELTPAEQAHIKDLQAQQRNIYDAAWTESLG